MTFSLRLTNFTPLPTPVVVVQLIASPLTAIALNGQSGGPFLPASFTISVSTPFGSVGYSITAPPWLDISSPTGTASTSPTTITFTPNAATNALAGGVYSGSITITNTAFMQVPIVIPVGVTVVPFPVGASAIWYFDEYSSTPNPLVPNSVAATPASSNVFRMPRRQFTQTSPAGAWSVAGGAMTIVDNAAVAPDGSNDASTLTAAAAWLLEPSMNTTLPAGTYTMAINVKRNTGSDQPFRFSKDFTTTTSAQLIATAAWQRFSYTFTLAAPTTPLNKLCLCSDDFGAATGADIQICDFECFPSPGATLGTFTGANPADLGPEVPSGHMYVSNVGSIPLPTPGTGFLDFSNGAIATAQFPSTLAFPGVTAMAAARKITPGVGARGGYQPFLSNIDDYERLAALLEQFPTDAALGKYGLSHEVVNPGYLGANGDVIIPRMDAGAQGWHTFAMRYDGTNLQFWIDDMTMASFPVVLASVDAYDFFINTLANTTLSSYFQFSEMALWNRGLTDQEMVDANATMKLRGTISGITHSPARLLVAEGDSISSITDNYVHLYGLAPPNPRLFGINYAISGSSLSHLITRASELDGILPASIGTRKMILSVFDGHNDIAAVTTTAQVDTWLAAYVAYLTARRAAGWNRIAVGTILPSTATAGFNALRNYANPIIRTWVGLGIVDAIFDFANDPNMGNDADASDLAKYSDGTHPTSAGSAFLAPNYAAVINAF